MNKYLLADRFACDSIETSALDASNVENAFQTILTGQYLHSSVYTAISVADSSPRRIRALEIYRIVSSKQLEADPISSRPGNGATIEIAPSPNDGGQSSSSKCC